MLEMNVAPSVLSDCESSADFLALEVDLGVPQEGRFTTAKWVCIVVPNMPTLVENEEIGAGNFLLARLLTGWGHEVVIACSSDDAADAALIAKSETFCAELGVAFVPISPRPAANSAMARIAAPTWALLEWLRARERPFDIVHMSEWRGLGYGPLLAKSLGLAFAKTHFVIKGSSPTLWGAEGDRQLLSTEHDLGWVFMERRSVELADTFISGSAHLLQWMREAGYALPERAFVWPNVFPAPDPAPSAVAQRAARDGVQLEEVVFFGRLEPRKGLVLFIDAMDRLARRGRAPARITFLGKPSSIYDGLEHIRRAARDWLVEVRTLTDHGSKEAVAYLSQPGRLAVIPSLLENSSMAVMECLQAGIPFVAAATGGTPELVAREDRNRALVAPEHIALGERIAELAEAPLRAVRPRWDFERSLEVWSRWHGQSAPFVASAERFARHAKVALAETPLVTVCIVHHERPALVRMAVESVYAQDYPALEAVLVDDGSEGSQALAVLGELEAEFSARGWRVIRQENRFAGTARNTAATAARGEWLVFLDDDNVLFPDAVTRLVRAARFSGADCVPAASIRFFGDADPRTDLDSHGPPIRFLGAARAWSRFRNVVGDTCALVRRRAFDAVGGYPEQHGLWLQDLCFNNRLIRGGWQVEPLPDPTCYYRMSAPGTGNHNRTTEAAHVQALAPYLQGRSDEERAFSLFAVGQTDISATESFNSSKVVRMLAEQAMSRRRWPLACDLWSELRDRAPEHEGGYVQGAEALLNADRLDEADDLAREAMEKFPAHVGGHLSLGEVAMRRKDWTEASARWEAMRAAFPGHVSGWVRGAEALMNAGRVDESAAVADEAVKRFPEHPGGYVHRGEVAMRRRDWIAAGERWAELRRVFPDQASGFVRSAEALMHAGRLEEAEALAREAAARFPDRPGGYVQQGEVAMRRRDWAPALECWAALRDAFPDHVSGYLRAAEALVNAGRLEDAEMVAREAVERFPEHSGGYVQWSEAAMRREEWAAASERYAALRGAFPDLALGYARGAEALVNAGRLEEAEAVAGEAVERFPDRPGGYVQWGEAAMRREDWERASERWAALRGAFPDLALGYARGAEALVNAGRLEEAEALAGEAVERFPDRPEGYAQWGEAAMRREDWERANERWAALRGAFPDLASGWIRGAEALLRLGRLEEAEAVAGEAVERFPDRPEGYAQWGEAAMRREDWESASERWAALRGAFPDLASGWIRGAEALLRLGRLEEAEAVAGEAVERFPGRASGHVHRGEIAMRRGDWAAASERWAALRGAFPDLASGWIRGAEALLRLGRLEEAEAVAGEAVERFPGRASGHVHRGEIAMRRGDWAAASERWADMREGFPGHASGWIRGAEALLRLGRLEEAEALAGEAVERFPDRPGGYVQWGEAAMRREDWERASERWAALRGAFPDLASGWIRGAEALLRLGRLEEAEAVAGEAVERFPEQRGGYVQWGEAAMRREDWERASERWAALRGAFPDLALGYARGAEALVNAGRLEEAEAVAGEAVERFPDRPGGYVQWGEAAMRREDWERASERWAALRGAFPDLASGYVRGAEALVNAGRLEEAEAVAGEAVERFPGRASGHVHRGEIAMRRGDWAAASERWAALRKVFPDHASGYVRGAEALVNAARLDEAQALASEAVQRFPNHPGGYMQRAAVAMRRGDWAVARGLWPEICRTLADQAFGPVRGMALVQPNAWCGFGHLEVGVVLAADWVARARRQRGRGPLLELRRNGTVVMQADAQDLARDCARFAAGRSTPARGDTLYSLHDAVSGEVLAALVAPSFLRARHVAGALENRTGAEVRGWVLDAGSPERVRRVAIHVDGSLRAVVDAGRRREDIARWKGTGGGHGFAWTVPEELVARERTRVEVFDAETGRALRGSPLRIEGGEVMASGGRGR